MGNKEGGEPSRQGREVSHFELREWKQKVTVGYKRRLQSIFIKCNGGGDTEREREDAVGGAVVTRRVLI